MTETSETLGKQASSATTGSRCVPSWKRHPGVLLLGGSERGLVGALLPAMLAAQGYPTLDVAYFKEPGLPQSLEDIPLGYCVKALRWLAARPGVAAAGCGLSAALGGASRLSFSASTTQAWSTG